MHFMSLCLCERVEAINTSLAIQPILVVASRKAHTDTIYFTGLRNTAKLLISCTWTHVWLVFVCLCVSVCILGKRKSYIVMQAKKLFLSKLLDCVSFSKHYSIVCLFYTVAQSLQYCGLLSIT